MYRSLTNKQATRKFGGVKKMRSEFSKIAKKYGVNIYVCHQFNEEEPDDLTQDWLNIIFGYTSGSRTGYINSKYDVLKVLHTKGLTFEYECNGDGDNEILSSFRVVCL